MPIGSVATANYLFQVAEVMGISLSLVEHVVNEAVKEYTFYFQRVWELLSKYNPAFPDHFIIAADAQNAVSIGRFLFEELGISPLAVFVTDSTPFIFQSPVQEMLPFTDVYFSGDYKVMEKVLLKIPLQTQFFFLGSACDALLVRDMGGYYMGISHPLSDRIVFNRSYCGWHGALCLMEDIFCQIELQKYAHKRKEY
jgi:nitrogenase molybdenum-iron protein beta chain